MLVEKSLLIISRKELGGSSALFVPHSVEYQNQNVDAN